MCKVLITIFFDIEPDVEYDGDVFAVHAQFTVVFCQHNPFEGRRLLSQDLFGSCIFDRFRKAKLYRLL